MGRCCKSLAFDTAIRSKRLREDTKQSCLGLVRLTALPTTVEVPGDLRDLALEGRNIHQLCSDQTAGSQLLDDLKSGILTGSLHSGDARLQGFLTHLEPTAKGPGSSTGNLSRVDRPRCSQEVLVDRQTSYSLRLVCS